MIAHTTTSFIPLHLNHATPITPRPPSIPSLPSKPPIPSIPHHVPSIGPLQWLRSTRLRTWAHSPACLQLSNQPNDEHSTFLPSTPQDSQDNQGNQDSQSNRDNRSIGEVVQGLHGGKYQFSNSQYLPGNSFVGRQFAESLYGSGNNYADEFDGDENEFDAMDAIDDGAGDGGTLPKWATRMQDMEEQRNKPIIDTLKLVPNQKVTISIKNEERSWERFCAFLLPSVPSVPSTSLSQTIQTIQTIHTIQTIQTASPAQNAIEIFPVTGQLAPRGGAANACDESKPYSDSAIISMELNNNNSDVSGGSVDKEWLLVVGTEAEVWRSRLVSE